MHMFVYYNVLSFSWNAQWNGWIISYLCLNFEKLPNCFVEWPYCFIFYSTCYESSVSSVPSPNAYSLFLSLILILKRHTLLCVLFVWTGSQLCRPGYPWTLRSACLCPEGLRLKVVFLIPDFFMVWTSLKCRASFLFVRVEISRTPFV